MAKKRGGRKYGPKAQKKVERAMHERKRGTLRSGGSAARRSGAGSRLSPSVCLRPAGPAPRSPANEAARNAK